MLVRLCAAIPLPYVNQVRYFGVLASAAANRDEVVPQTEPPEGPLSRRLPPVTSSSFGETSDAAPLSQRRRWAWLLAHTFGADLEKCEKCGGPMRWVTVAKTRAAAARLMSQLGYARAPPTAPDPCSQGGPEVIEQCSGACDRLRCVDCAPRGVVCNDGDVYIIDSCDEVVEMVSDCDSGCAVGQCVEGFR